MDHLGDAVLSTGMFAARRRRYPAARIDVLVGVWNRALFEAMPEVDHVFGSRVNRFSRHGRFGWWLAVFWWGWRLRHQRYDLGIDVRGEFPLALILWLAGVRRRLGWAAGGGGFLLTDSPTFVVNRPEVESRGALLAQLGIDADPASLRPRFQPTEAARRTVDRLLSKEQVREPFVAVHVSAGTPAKSWPAEHFRELIGRLRVFRDQEIVLIGGPSDRSVSQEILLGRSWPGVHDWTGRFDPVELAALLERAAVLVGADSGPAHLAAAVGTPVVVLFSGASCTRQWRPPGEHVTVLREEVPCRACHRRVCPVAGHPCMSGLRPAVVARAIEDALNPSPDARRHGESEVARDPHAIRWEAEK